MRVRPLRDEADTRAIIEVHARAWRAAYEGLLPAAVMARHEVGPPDQEQVAAEFDRLSGYGEGRVLVAEGDGGPVRGYAVFRWGPNETKASVRDGEAELKELYVDPDHWGRGLGTALLEAGIERLPPDVDGLALEVLEGNDVGVSFYEARGFEHDGDSTYEVDGRSVPTRVYRRSLR